MDYTKYKSHNILCIDMKSFYASCEAVSRGLDPMTAKVVVAGDVSRNGSVILASSPVMKKKYNIKTGSRLYEVKAIFDKEIIVAQARMEYYLNMSKKIQEIFQSFVPPDSIHVYSVDESWLTLDGTEKLWGDAWSASEKILKKIKEDTGLIATIGIGDNKFLAKFCLDVYGKEEGIAECRYVNVEKMFHHIPVREMWGIGEGIEKRLSKMNIATVGDLAKSNITDLKKEFGVIGEQLYEHAWGIDESPVFYDEKNPPSSAFGFFNDDSSNESIKSVGRGVTLLKDYTNTDDILLVMREIIEEVCEVLRKRKLEGKTVHLTIDLSHREKQKGFSRQLSFKENRSNSVADIYDMCKQLFEKYHKKGNAVRFIRVSVGNLKKEIEQFTFDEDKAKKKRVAQTRDLLNDKFGKGTLMSASSLKKTAVAKDRNNRIGGHKK